MYADRIERNYTYSGNVFYLARPKCVILASQDVVFIIWVFYYYFISQTTMTLRSFGRLVDIVSKFWMFGSILFLQCEVIDYRFFLLFAQTDQFSIDKRRIDECFRGSCNSKPIPHKSFYNFITVTYHSLWYFFGRSILFKL